MHATRQKAKASCFFVVPEPVACDPDFVCCGRMRAAYSMTPIGRKPALGGIQFNSYFTPTGFKQVAYKHCRSSALLLAFCSVMLLSLELHRLRGQQP